MSHDDYVRKLRLTQQRRNGDSEFWCGDDSGREGSSPWGVLSQHWWVTRHQGCEETQALGKSSNSVVFKAVRKQGTRLAVISVCTLHISLNIKQDKSRDD